MIYITRGNRISAPCKMDVSASITHSGNSCTFGFHNDCWKKIGERVMFGYDEDNNRIYFIANENSYKISLSANGNHGYVQSKNELLIKWCALNLGHFDLQYDKEKELYYIQGVNELGSDE